MKPFYDQDGQTIFHGDNCDVLGGMPRECIDLVVTSPPYDDLRTYGGHSWDFYGVAWQLKRVLKPGGVIVWVVADATVDGSETGSSMEQALHFKRLGLNLHDTMIYEKSQGGAVGSHSTYWQYWEFMFIVTNGVPKTVNRLRDRYNISAGHLNSGSGKKNEMVGTRLKSEPKRTEEIGVRSNLWKYGHGNMHGDNHDHPAPFPERLARDHILSWSNPGDVVLDPFLGSGTTLKMAKECGRRGIGIEVNADYCGIAAARLAQGVLFGASA